MNAKKINDLKINQTLFDFINTEVIPGTNLDIDKFWDKFSKVVHELSPINRQLLKKREDIQKQIDEWHLNNPKEKFNKNKYIQFLKSISYLVEEGNDFKINTSNVDDEIAKIAGPQLVVPVDNARYALNAANARWGSLYDALYGTDVIPGDKGKSFNKDRGDKVIEYSRNFLDEIFPLNNNSWKNVDQIKVEGKDLILNTDKGKSNLNNPNQFIGFNGDKSSPTSILLRNNNLHFDIIIDSSSPIGKNDKANISDIILESAVSTIIDNEDSVAAVDGEDKVNCYRNWLGLMKGDLISNMEKNGKKFVRKLNLIDHMFQKKERRYHYMVELLLNRNVGHLMTNPAIILKDGSEIPEGIMDAFVSTMCALHDFKNQK